MPGQVGDAVGLNAYEVGVDQDIGADRGVVGGDAVGLEHGRGEAAQV